VCSSDLAYSFGLGPEITDVTQALVDETHQLGLAIHPYTANSEAEIEGMVKLCVDGMFTNFTDRYRRQLAARDYGCPPPRR
jgi:glycerophosphoryl diester phosphodiesterase